MENSSRFFANTSCKYYPCHEGVEDFNCLFCYCPLNAMEHCPGKPHFMESKGRIIKDCMGCNFPHKPENYDIILEFLKKNLYSFDKHVLTKSVEK